MKYILLLSLLSASAFAGETWDKTKTQINNTADNVDHATRETINKGKAKWQQRQEEKDRQKELDERAEYQRLKKKYGKDDI
jgi:hypothetical protein